MANITALTNQPSDLPHPGMIWIAGGTFRMGSEDFYPEERPVHEVSVDGFWIDRHLVTNEAFARFVATTVYLTLAERPLNAADFPGAPVENLLPGSMLFHKTANAVDVVKGGSHLCAPNYCLRYRPAARQPQMVDTGMSHIGIRCIVRQVQE